MKYTIVDGQVIYEGPTEDYILSNVELTLRLKNGTPAELFSSKNGLLIEFSKNDLPNPASSRLWPNGCEFSHKKTTWSFFTSLWIRSMLWELNGLERLVLSFKAPLEKRFKVPFGPTYSFKKLLNVIVEGCDIDLSNLVRIEVLEGRIGDHDFRERRGVGPLEGSEVACCQGDVGLGVEGICLLYGELE